MLCTFMIGLMIFWTTANVTHTEAGLKNPGTGIITTSYFELPSGFFCTGDSCFGTLATTISGAGGTLLGSGTQIDPYIIENLNITGSNGMVFNKITKYVTIRNNIINTKSSHGIILDNMAETILIQNNNITSGNINYDGTHAIYATMINSSIIVKDNYFNNNTDWAVNIGEGNPGLGRGGINNTYVYNNTFVNNIRSIFSVFTNSTNIYNNSIFNNIETAITIQENTVTKIYNNKILGSYIGMNLGWSNYSLVENNTIDSISATNYAGIQQYNTHAGDISKDVYIIRNNTLTNVAGMGIDTQSFMLIEGNTIKNTGSGGIRASFNTTIQNNWVENYNLLKTTNGQGRGIQGYNNMIVIGNTIVNGDFEGIYTDGNAEVINNEVRNVGSDGIYVNGGIIKITGNTVVNSSWDGIRYTGYQSTGIISQNTIQDSKQNGLHLLNVQGSTVSANIISNSGGSGISLEQSANSLVTSNSVTSSKLFGMYLYSSPSTFSNNVFSEEIAIDNQGATSTVDTYLGYSFTSNTVRGAPFVYIIDGTTDITTQQGQIYIVNSDGIAITNNNFANHQIPITIAFSTSIVLEASILTNNSIYAVRIIGLQSSMKILDSTISNTHGTGIWSDGSVDVRNSKIIDNHGDGLYVSSQSLIYENEISRNEGFGVRIHWISNGVTVRDNLFDSNVGYGVAIESVTFSSPSQNAIIHHNNFINNNAAGISQALDNGSNNQWYDFETMEGNYWGDWSGSGTYLLDGTANNEDPYPIGTQITFPRPVPQSTTTTPTGSDPTNTEPSDTFTPTSLSEDTEAGFLPSPSISILGMILMYFVTDIRRRKKRNSNIS
ncbi:MAG: hypothetical protein HeimC2_35820 [Candidatus Heimdallarchaeota archaeon LC_2]|nr:MAG: hypothetical protein HeimC2_35820 [Candidatus Heimdallarchaeota archaeon LC_2]